MMDLGKDCAKTSLRRVTLAPRHLMQQRDMSNPPIAPFVEGQTGKEALKGACRCSLQLRYPAGRVGERPIFR
jgi:hypothetical protein